VGKQMVVSWFITIPAAALLSSLIFIMLEVLIGG
jgi:phosphate/sulfate permease